MNANISGSVGACRMVHLSEWMAAVIIGFGLVPLARAVWLTVEVVGTLAGAGPDGTRELARLICP